MKSLRIIRWKLEHHNDFAAARFISVNSLVSPVTDSAMNLQIEKSGSDSKVHHNRMLHFRFNFNFDNYSRQQHVAQQSEFVCKKGAKSD